MLFETLTRRFDTLWAKYRKCCRLRSVISFPPITFTGAKYKSESNRYKIRLVSCSSSATHRRLTNVQWWSLFLLAPGVSGYFQTMAMNRPTSQTLFSHGNTICKPHPWAHSHRLGQVRLKRLSLHTSCHSHTASHSAQQHTDSSVIILCWPFSLRLSIL